MLLSIFFPFYSVLIRWPEIHWSLGKAPIVLHFAFQKMYMTAALVNNTVSLASSNMLYWSSSRSSYVLFGEIDVVFRVLLGFRSQMAQIIWILRILVVKVHSPFCLMSESKHLWKCKGKQQRLTRTDIQLFPCILEQLWGCLTAEGQGEGRVRSAQITWWELTCDTHWTPEYLFQTVWVNLG